jgi:NIMA (never in mitosis gene a)-related kinase
MKTLAKVFSQLLSIFWRVGSYGKVALVRHKESGEEMVWKQTNYGGMNDKEKQQLINEVNILRELKHENIVRCYDKFVDKR